MRAIFETAFDIVYLASVITLGALMLRGCRGRRQYLLYGLMALVLGGGDAFHLVPRALALCTTGLDSYTAALGIGKLITSITMTAFYVMLYHVWRERYGVSGRKGLTSCVWGLALCRAALCLMPQNAWTSPDAPLLWGILRNIPFTIMGAMIVWLFFRGARENNDARFKHLWLAVTLSFSCYLPVVLFSGAYPAVGMLMIPKTCAYVWVVVIGYRAMRAEE